jgi:hypothetical protein
MDEIEELFCKNQVLILIVTLLFITGGNNLKYKYYITIIGDLNSLFWINRPFIVPTSRLLQKPSLLRVKGFSKLNDIKASQ